MEIVTFVPEEQIRVNVRRAFRRHKLVLEQLLPTAEIIHVGSTAVPDSLTKGDLDVQVRVPRDEFAHARAQLATRYERNRGSSRTRTFASFQDESVTPKLGIQLTASGSRFDHFQQLTEFLVEHPEINQLYNALKQRFDGKSMAAYRRAKSRFLESLLPELPRKRRKRQ